MAILEGTSRVSVGVLLTVHHATLDRLLDLQGGGRAALIMVGERRVASKLLLQQRENTFKLKKSERREKKREIIPGSSY